MDAVPSIRVIFMREKRLKTEITSELMDSFSCIMILNKETPLLIAAPTELADI